MKDKRLPTFNRTYFVLAIGFFIAEVAIALFVNDAFIRPYFGDVLVVILMYCFLRSFFRLCALKCAIAVLLIAYAIETLQYFNLAVRLKLEHSALARTVLGHWFAWEDLVAYTAGFLIVVFAEQLRTAERKKNKSES